MNGQLWKLIFRLRYSCRRNKSDNDYVLFKIEELLAWLI